MSDLSVTNTFIALTTAVASQVNANFSDIVNYINNRDDGTATWDNMNVTATVGNPVTIKSNQSTTELAIDNTASDGDPILTWKLSGSTIFTAGPDDSDSDVFKFGTTGLNTNIAFQIPSTGVQTQFAVGSAATPGIAFIGVGNRGLYSNVDGLNVTTGGSQVAVFATSGLQVIAGSFGSPSITTVSDTNTGLYWDASDQMTVSLGGSPKFTFTGTNFIPGGAGTISSGNGTDYWNDISYKTLTDRGCLPWCDEGVELVDGRIVSDLESLCQIQKHPTQMTIQGLPKLDYSTFPKKAYKKEEKGEDGIEMTMMFGVMIGAFKEISRKINDINVRLNSLNA